MTETAEGGQVLDLALLSDDKPLLLLDVDGVINVFNNSNNPRKYFRHVARTPIGSFKLKISTAVPDMLATLSEHYHLVWCTMWDHGANEHISPLVGLPTLPFIPCFGRRMGVAYAENDARLHHKVRSIIHHVDARPFAWVDDEVGLADHAWAEQRSVQVPTHIEKTIESQGLIDHQVKRLITWAMNLKEAQR